VSERRLEVVQVNKETNVALIEAAVALTSIGTGRLADRMASDYKTIYAAVVEAFEEHDKVED